MVKRYPKDFREQVVAMARSQNNVYAAAKKHGVTWKTVNKWMRRSEGAVDEPEPETSAKDAAARFSGNRTPLSLRIAEKFKTIENFANTAGISIDTYYRTNRNLPVSPVTLKKIAGVLDMGIDDLNVLRAQPATLDNGAPAPKPAAAPEPAPAAKLTTAPAAPQSPTDERMVNTYGTSSRLYQEAVKRYGNARNFGTAAAVPPDALINFVLGRSVPAESQALMAKALDLTVEDIQRMRSEKAESAPPAAPKPAAGEPAPAPKAAPPSETKPAPQAPPAAAEKAAAESAAPAAAAAKAPDAKAPAPGPAKPTAPSAPKSAAKPAESAKAEATAPAKPTKAEATAPAKPAKAEAKTPAKPAEKPAEPAKAPAKAPAKPAEKPAKAEAKAPAKPAEKPAKAEAKAPAKPAEKPAPAPKADAKPAQAASAATAPVEAPTAGAGAGRALGTLEQMTAQCTNRPLNVVVATQSGAQGQIRSLRIYLADRSFIEVALQPDGAGLDVSLRDIGGNPLVSVR